MLQATPPHFLHRTENERVRDTVSRLPRWTPRTLVVNGETTKTLLVWPHHPTQHHFEKHPAMHPGVHGKKVAPDEKEAGHRTGVDQAELTDPTTHGRRQVKLAKSLRKWHCYGNSGQWMKVIIIHLRLPHLLLLLLHPLVPCGEGTTSLNWLSRRVDSIHRNFLPFSPNLGCAPLSFRDVS